MSVLESPYWYRVARLRPALRPHVQVHRHRYRGAPWYVLQDAASGRQHRLDARAHAFVAACDGQRTVAEVFEGVSQRLGDDAPDQSACIEVLGRLHAADLIQCDVTPDTRELFARFRERRSARRWQAFRSPFFVRLPLYDPERLLQRLAGVGRWVFNPWALVLWCALVLAGGAAALMHWPQLRADAGLNLFSPINLLTLWLIYPVVKALHELGHALAVKHWGGEVHDTGVMLLVFVPVPYVDASAANAFEDKRARMAVAGAGIAVELALAALAAFVWLNVEPGLVRTVALNVMAIGGISTLLFNGNPLLKFDGYYVLADLIEIPNLAGHANRYYGYLARRYLLGIDGAVSPARSAGERRWFAFYGVAAFAYRTFILFAILLFVAGISLTAAVVLGAWAVLGQIVVPLVRRVRDLAGDPQVRERGLRAAAVTMGLCAAVLAVALAPAPQRTTVEGVVWRGDDAQVRTGSDCFVERVMVASGAGVEPGQPLIACADPLQSARLTVLRTQVAELQARHARERVRDRAQSRIVADELAAAEAELADALERAAQLTVRSPAAGVFHLPAAQDLPGRFAPQGELLGHVVAERELGVRVALPQSHAARVREDTRRIDVLLPGPSRGPVEARLTRFVPGATHRLPSPALGTAAGGKIPADPASSDGSHALAPLFVADLAFVDPGVPRAAGARAQVRITHSPRSVGAQAWESLRRLFLRRLAV